MLLIFLKKKTNAKDKLYMTTTEWSREKKKTDKPASMKNIAVSMETCGTKGDGEGIPELVALNRVFDNYKASGNFSGMDAVMRAIHQVEEKNGLELSDYVFASDDITTTVSLMKNETYTLDDIHQLHKNNDYMALIAGIPSGTGPVLGPLFSFVSEMEKSGESSISTVVKNVALADLGMKNTGVGLIAAGVDTGISLNQDTYYRDGVNIQEGDSYILIQTRTNQGLDVADIKVYVRNNEIISYEKYGPYGSQSNPYYNNIIRNNWEKNGYK